jgi:cytoskeletal protein CcmA (bactofilin family)
MPKKEAFIIPEGLQFEHTNKGVSIQNHGDIVIKGSLGMVVHRLVSTDGNIYIENALAVNEIIALNGTVSSDASLTVDSIQAKELTIGNDLTVQNRVHVSKKMLIHGDLNTPIVQSLGDLEVHGSVTCDELSVERHANIGKNVTAQRIQTEGELHIKGDASCTEFHHAGTLIHLGSLTANALYAPNATVHINTALTVNQVHCTNLIASGKINAPTMQVHETIQLTEATIHADVLIGKRFETTGDVSGKVLVLEVPQQTGSHRIKGCLELSDFAEFVPDLDAFLTSRGLTKQANGIVVTPIESKNIEDQYSSEESSDSNESDTPLHVDLNAIPTQAKSGISEEATMMFDDEVTTVDTPQADATPARIAVPMIDQSASTARESIEEHSEQTEVNLDDAQTDVELSSADTDESVLQLSEELVVQDTAHSTAESDAVNIDEAIPTEALMSEEWTYDEGDVSQEPEVPEPNPIHDAIRIDIVALINEYDDTNYPSAVQELLEYLETEDYFTLQDELRHIWSNLLKHHQSENSRIPGAATLAFTSLSKNLQKLD